MGAPSQASQPSLQDGIDKAGSPMRLLWQQNPAPWNPENIDPEYAGWQAEQHAWHDAVSLSDVSHHMFDTFIDGPDATRLLSDVSANNYENFAVGQAKQFVPSTSDGNIVTDGILARTAEQVVHPVRHPRRAELGQVPRREGRLRRRLQHRPVHGVPRRPGPAAVPLPGPGAAAHGTLVEAVFGGPLPPSKFFHSIPVRLDGREFSALRHNMAGQDGYEFIGPWEHAAFVKDTLLTAGAKFGLVRVGALAYASASVESGWIPSPVPAIYTDPGLADYRAWLPLFGIEGKRPLNGSFYSDNIEDYYVSPVGARLRPLDLVQPRLHRPRRAARGQGDRAAHQGHAGPRRRTTSARCSARTTATTSPTPGTAWSSPRLRRGSSASPTRRPRWTPRARSWRSRSSTRSTPLPAPRSR